MSRIIIVCAFAAIFTMPAKAQSLKDQLIGAWALVSCDGRAFPFTVALCTNPNGIHKTITYHFDGALLPSLEGTDAKSPAVSVSKDELKIGSNVWRRIRN